MSLPHPNLPVTTEEARENIAYMRDFLRDLPPERFDMEILHNETACGTVACIAGWTVSKRSPDPPSVWSVGTMVADARDLLGLDRMQSYDLFFKYWEGSGTPARAAEVLDHYLRTGEIA